MLAGQGLQMQGEKLGLGLSVIGSKRKGMDG